jgi:hypothetical protein
MAKNLDQLVDELNAKMSGLKLSAERLQKGEKKASVDSRAYALEIQKLCGDVRCAALGLGKEIKPAKRAKVAKSVVSEIGAPEVNLESAVPSIKAPEEKLEVKLESIPEAPPALERQAALALEEPPKILSPEVKEEVKDAFVIPAVLSDVGAVKVRPRARK